MSNHQGRFTAQTIELIKGLHGVLGEDSLLAYVISMTLRVAEIHRVLTPRGTFFFHCDSTASHYLKLMLDSVFLPNGGDYLNEIIWKRSSAHSDAKQGAHHFGRISDTILFYSKSQHATWNQLYVPYDQRYIDRDYRRTDPDGRRYRISDLSGPGGTAKGNPSYEFLGVTRYWRYKKENMMELHRQGRIVQTRPGAVPQYKRYLDEMPGVPVQNVWIDIPVINNRSREKLGYPTQKPEALLERIIKATSNEGDVVLDAYCGCGTTIAVAQRLNRRWVGIDITYQAIATILARLEDQFGSEVIDSVVLDGLPKDMASAKALAHKKDDRMRKEFEKWAILTYTNNRAVIKKRKGADGGIDGVFYFWNGGTAESAKVVLQAKSGSVQRKDIAALRGDMEKEGAALACLITLDEPTKPMKQDAKAAGIYENTARGVKCDRIRVVRVEDIVHHAERIDLAMHPDATNKARRDTEGDQLRLDLRPARTEIAEAKKPAESVITHKHRSAKKRNSR
jgi:DNA modification methylase